jgi:hypothetical protein
VNRSFRFAPDRGVECSGYRTPVGDSGNLGSLFHGSRYSSGGG